MGSLAQSVTCFTVINHHSSNLLNIRSVQQLKTMKKLLIFSIFVNYIQCQSPIANTLDVSKAIKQFSNTLLSDIEVSSTSNFVFSPYSIHSVFSQLMFGAEGNTRRQLQSLLGLTPSDSVIAQYRSLSSNLKSGSAQLFTANEIALAQGFKPKPSYVQTLGSGYSIREYDFANNKIDSVRQINNDVQEKTQGHIKDLLLDQDVDHLTKMLLINAIYFKAQWKTAFNPDNTINSLFNSPVSGLVNTSFMTMDAKLRLLEVNDLDILELPYADETMSMILVLPKQESDQEISSKLEALDIASIRSESPRNVEVTIPKFNMKYQTYLKDKMTKLGAPDMFGNNANLRGISDQPLFVSNGIHQASIEVNEEGSEAAAATAVIVGVRTISRKKQFFADRPFLFMIYDFQNNIPLFVGKVVDPTNPIVVQEPPATSGLDINTLKQSVNNNNQGFQNTQNSQTQSQPDAAVCQRLVRDFPNALDNHKICSKVKEAGKFLDWLRENRNLCEQSSDHYNQFMQNSCSTVFCSDSTQSAVEWQRDYAAQCADIDRVNQQNCKNIENKLKAYNALNCNNKQ